jgi:hypothetical protein
MNLRKIEYVEATITQKFADYVTDRCRNQDCEYDNNLDAVDFYEGDITDLLYSCDTIVILQSNRSGTEFTLRGTETTMNLIVAGYVKHLENQAANDDDDLLADLI